eukprot:scaffold73263_cov65-Phaeocystis_antarctica.AAC.7
MALSKLSNDEQGIILGQLCNTLEPRRAMYFSSASSELRVLLTPAVRQQLRTDHEVAAALCSKMGMRSCKELREAMEVTWENKDLSATDLATLGTLGSVLPHLWMLSLCENAGSAGPDGAERLAEGLGAGALPAVTFLAICDTHVGDAGASALAAALGRSALPGLKTVQLMGAAIGDAGLVALAPGLRRRPALVDLDLSDNPFGDEGLAALVAPPPPAGTLPPRTGGLKKLKELGLDGTQVSDAGCAALAAALDSGSLPALEKLTLDDIPASAAAIDAVSEALARSRASSALQKKQKEVALSKLSNDEQGIILGQLCKTLEPRRAVYFSSASSELRVLLTPAVRLQLRADHEVAAALCHKMGMRSCKELREARAVSWEDQGLTAADLATLGTLGSVLPALETLVLIESSGSAGPDGVQRLTEGLVAGALPHVYLFSLVNMHVGDAGASALAAALGRSALPRLESLVLNNAALGDAGMVALAPALRRLPALDSVHLFDNPFGDEGLAALVAPPPPAGTLPLATGGLKMLRELDLDDTQITDAGCAALAAALDSGALPALKVLKLDGIPASEAAKAAVYEARANLGAVSEDESEDE